MFIISTYHTERCSDVLMDLLLFLQAIENLVRTHISTPVRPLVINNSLHLLWPQPQRMVELEGPPFVPQKELRISIIQSPVLIHRYFYLN